MQIFGVMLVFFSLGGLATWLFMTLREAEAIIHLLKEENEYVKSTRTQHNIKALK